MAAAVSPVWTSGVDLVKATAPTFTPAIHLVPPPPACKHPFDSVELDDKHGYTCTLCESPLIYCWQCASDGVYNMHPAPECDPGHMQVVYNSPRQTIHIGVGG